MSVDSIAAPVAITNLLARYAECIDTGDFESAARLFTHAQIKVGLGPDGANLIDSDALLRVWRDNVIVHGDGTPRTKHVITNANIDVDAAGNAATCHSYYTVFQQLDGFALQPIIAGRYHDSFDKVDGNWRWSYRDYTLVDLVGDLSRHLRMEVRL